MRGEGEVELTDNFLLDCQPLRLTFLITPVFRECSDRDIP